MHEPNQTLAQLRNVISELKQGGGSMTPSAYETAQVLRFCPELVEADKVMDWLLAAQQPDGGWGEPGPPLYRIVPTAAAILALHTYRRHEQVRQACAAAQRFLEEQETPIEAVDGEYLPVAMELILPRLLDELAEVGIVLPRARFQYLEELGARRRRLFAAHPPAPDSAAMFSWEAWGEEPRAEFVSGGGVGCNPAATAWWLHLDRPNGPSPARTQALNALHGASQSGGAGILGVVPDAWPMDRFEQCFVLYLTAIAGLSRDARLADVLALPLEDLRLTVGESGLGFSDYVERDGDDTAAAVVALAAAGVPIDYGALNAFVRGDRCVAYPFEAHGSFAVTARAAHAAHILGRQADDWRPYILSAQQPDGWWTGDKWNRSRVFGTCLAMTALSAAEDPAALAAVQTFLRYQYADGGWGCFGRPTLVETAYGLLALCSRVRRDGPTAACCAAMRAAHAYLRREYSVQRIETERMWICKDLYSVRRVDQAAVLCALSAADTLLGEG